MSQICKEEETYLTWLWKGALSHGAGEESQTALDALAHGLRELPSILLSGGGGGVVDQGLPDQNELGCELEDLKHLDVGNLVAEVCWVQLLFVQGPGATAGVRSRGLSRGVG